MEVLQISWESKINDVENIILGPDVWDQTSGYNDGVCQFTVVAIGYNISIIQIDNLNKLKYCFRLWKFDQYLIDQIFIKLRGVM